MLSLLTRVHRWVGLALGLVLLAVSASGVLLLAKGPYHRWQHPSFARPITDDDRARFPEVLDRIQAQLGDDVRTVKLPQPGLHAFQVWLRDGSEAFVDARSGAVIDRWQPTERLPALLFDLHAHLMAGRRGELVNGAIALLGSLFLVLGGLLVWWPRRKAMRLRALWPRTWTPGSLLRSHAAMGVLTAVPLLIFMVTGAGLALGEYALPALSRAFDASPPPTLPSRVDAPGGPRASWGDVLSSIDAAFPEGRQGARGGGPRLVFLSPGRHAAAPLIARVRLPGEWHPNGRSTVVVDPASARVLQAVDARALGTGTRLGHLLYPVHAARIGGSTSWLLVALAVVAGSGLACLSLSGVVTWLQRDTQGRIARAAAARPARQDGSPSRS